MDLKHINKILSTFYQRSTFIRSRNAFVFQDPESPTINSLYGWSGISAQFKLCSFMFSF